MSNIIQPLKLSSKPDNILSISKLDAHLLEQAKESSLSEEQQGFISDYLAKRNICVTGNAGTGKTFLLNWLRERTSLCVTASTGIAALHVKGTTVHSWTGIGLGTKSPEQIIEDLVDRRDRWRDNTLNRIQYAQNLVIDEISMISGATFDLIEQVIRLVRAGYVENMGQLNEEINAQAFGGLQVIVFGDFLQLPPVSKGAKKEKFAFEADAWKEADFKTILLTKVFRQEDELFSRVLHKIRLGEIDDDEVVDFLWERMNSEDPDPDRPACELHSHNKGCHLINMKKLREVPGEIETFEAILWAKNDNEKLLREICSYCLAPDDLKLKVGARVMLLANLDLASGLANGSMGNVVGWGTAPVDLEEAMREEPYIEVLFDNGKQRRIGRHEWELIKGEEVVARKIQFPLRLAYAITIHKSQGMTLDKVKAHLGRTFEKGQSYVALSRARSPEGLFIFGPDIDISAHPRAVKFYRETCGMK